MASASASAACDTCDSGAGGEGCDSSSVPSWREIVPRAFVAQVLSQEECDKLLARFSPGEYKSLEDEYPVEYRSGSRVIFDDPTLAAELLAKTLAAIPPLREGVNVEPGSTSNPQWAVGREDGGLWLPHSLNPRFRLNKTVKGQHFSKHSDGMYHLEPPRVKGWMTFLLYLTTMGESDGGSTLFYYTPTRGSHWRSAVLAASYRPVAGQVLVFDHGILHAGEKVSRTTAVEKLVMRTDVEFTRERPDCEGKDSSTA